MKDSEIVKALKCCSSLAVGHCTPDDCPYYNIEHCSDQLRLDAANRVEKLSDIYATVCTKWDSEEAMVQESHSSTISIKGALRRFWLRAKLAKGTTKPPEYCTTSEKNDGNLKRCAVISARCIARARSVRLAPILTNHKETDYDKA